jgi:phosphoglycolate phosphatase-like HAD superfamily hydrolase
MPKLILFDIDGTLVLTGGAGSRAMTRAFLDVFGVRDGFEGILMAGRTDDLILTDAFAKARLPDDSARTARFRARYLECLAEEIRRPHPGKRVMPGIVRLLDALKARADVFLGLLTGNYPEAARIKLEHFDLWRYFACGAFAGDAVDRNSLVPVAVQRARACGFRLSGPRDVWVVGDTPLDVACARAAGAVAVAVATGGCDAPSLHAAGADVVFEDLADTGRFLALLEGNERAEKWGGPPCPP